MRTIEFSMYLPTGLLELQELLDFAFLEPINERKYIEFYKSSTINKVLDNGFIENNGQSLRRDLLLDYANEVLADVVIAPDQLGNWDYNLNNARILRQYHNGACPVLGGPDWQEQADDTIEDNFRSIFLPYRLNRQPVSFDGTVHLLGYKHPEAYLPFAAKCSSLALDTVEPISAAYNGWEYKSKGFATFPRPQGYGFLNSGNLDIRLCRQNILWLKDFLANPVR